MPRKKQVVAAKGLAKPKLSKKPSKATAPTLTPASRLAAKPTPVSSTPPKLPRAHQLFIQACQIPAQRWEVFGGILLIYGLLNALLVGGLTAVGDLAALKDNLSHAFTGQFSQLGTGLTLAGFLAANGANNAASGVAGAYSVILLMITSLAIIWALRQAYAGHVMRIRDAFYNGMQPLVQTILVVFVVGLQLLPAGLGSEIYSLVMSNDILQGPIEIGTATGVLLLLLIWSVYMLSSSLFALYIVALPNMTPGEALKSARSIVSQRRAHVIVKLLALPVGLAIIASIIIVPIALLLTPAAPFVFYILSVIALGITHSYMYALYRALIEE